MSPSGCLSLKLKVPWGCLHRGVCHWNWRCCGDVFVRVLIEGAAGMSPSGCLSLKLKVPQGCLHQGVCHWNWRCCGDVSVGVFVIEIEGAAGMSPSGCLSLKLKVPRGCLRRGVCHWNWRCHGDVSVGVFVIDCKRCSVSYRRCGSFIQRRWVWRTRMRLLLQRCEDQAIAWSEFDVFSTEIVYASEIRRTIPAFSLRKSSRETSTRIDWIKRLNTSRECSAFSRSNHLLTSRAESGTTLNPDVERTQWWFDWTRRWKKRYTCS